MNKVLLYLFSVLIPKGVNPNYLLTLENNEIVKYIPRITVQQFRTILMLYIGEKK